MLTFWAEVSTASLKVTSTAVADVAVAVRTVGAVVSEGGGGVEPQPAPGLAQRLSPLALVPT